MSEIILNGAEIKDKKSAFEYFCQEFNAPDYFVPTLDSFWDYLMSIDKPVKIVLENAMNMKIALKGYSECILEVFIEANKHNENIRFEYTE